MKIFQYEIVRIVSSHMWGHNMSDLFKRKVQVHFYDNFSIKCMCKACIFHEFIQIHVFPIFSYEVRDKVSSTFWDQGGVDYHLLGYYRLMLVPKHRYLESHYS